jgi:predicted nucleotidyltransferase
VQDGEVAFGLFILLISIIFHLTFFPGKPWRTSKVSLISKTHTCYNLSDMDECSLYLPEDKVIAFCQRWNVTEFAIFGSALRQDFNALSDVDVLVSFDDFAETTLFDLAQMQIELEDLFNRPVDLIEKAALRNPYRREEILKTAQVVYAG